MKQGRTMQDLAMEVMRQFREKQDMIVPSSLISMNESAELVIEENHFPVRENAHQQISNKLGIPQGYYSRMLREDPNLLQQNVNTWLSRSKDRRMVRVLDGSVRAVLSDRYLRLDNYDLLESVLPIFNADVAFKVASCEVTETKLFLKVINAGVRGEVRVGDVVEAGVMITNSEVGAGTLSIDPFLHRLICLNGAVMNKTGIRRVHLGRQAGETEDVLRLYSETTKNLDAKAFFSKVKDLVTSTFDQVRFNEMLDMVKDAARDKMEVKPFVAVERLENRKMINSEDGQSVLEKLISGGDMTRYGLANAVTSYSQEVESYSRATELEVLGGDLLTMPRNEWNEIGR